MDVIDCTAGLAIVEDERDLVNIYVRVFNMRKISVCFIAYDGAQAIALFKKASPTPNIVLMDNRLPMMSGIDVTREMLKLAPNTKVIFVSADPEAEKMAMESGAAMFLKKPVRANELLKAIDSVLK